MSPEPAPVPEEASSHASSEAELLDGAFSETDKEAVTDTLFRFRTKRYIPDEDYQAPAVAVASVAQVPADPVLRRQSKHDLAEVFAQNSRRRLSQMRSQKSFLRLDDSAIDYHRARGVDLEPAPELSEDPSVEDAKVLAIVSMNSVEVCLYAVRVLEQWFCHPDPVVDLSLDPQRGAKKRVLVRPSRIVTADRWCVIMCKAFSRRSSCLYPNGYDKGFEPKGFDFESRGGRFSLSL